MAKTLPQREMLQALARSYRRLQSDAKHEGAKSSERQHLEERLVDVRNRFERLLVEWVPQDRARKAWNAYLDKGRGAPGKPTAVRPLVFRGVSEFGAMIEVRRAGGGDLDVDIDGALAERLDAAHELDDTEPHLRFRLDGTAYLETFEVSLDALDALADFVEGGAPPWDAAPGLLADGLIDSHFALTPRGRRALSARPR